MKTGIVIAFIISFMMTILLGVVYLDKPSYEIESIIIGLVAIDFVLFVILILEKYYRKY